MKTKLNFIKRFYYQLRGDRCPKCGTLYTYYGTLAYWCSRCVSHKPKLITDYVFSGGLIKGDNDAR